MSGVELLARGVVQYGRGSEAPLILKGVSLDLVSGLTAMVGPNGSGKTTLLRTLAGLLPPWEGHVEVGPVALQDDPVEVRRRVGYLPQFPGVFHRLSVRQHFERQALWLPGQDADRIELALQRFGLGAQADVMAEHLSAARRRWLALALLWARRTQVLLLDEPTAGLDVEDRLVFWDQMLELVAEEDGPRAILVTTHLLDEVETYCKNVIMLAGGRAVFQGMVTKFKDRGRGRAFLLDRGAPVPAEALEVGLDPATGERWAIVPERPVVGEGRLREPTVMDGYLVVEREWSQREVPA
ncbi:MAG: ABC transporter ATP-binding protein [Clostridia bacterium]